MITKKVTKKQLSAWKAAYVTHAPGMTPNRISGTSLDTYFREKYHPQPVENGGFAEMVRQSALAQYPQKPETDVRVYVLGEVTIGIGLDTGFIHVESENMEPCIPIYDDLFVTRGLDEEDLRNFVLAGQYIELLAQQGAVSQ